MRIPGKKTMKQRLQEGEVLFGTFYKFNCAPVVEMLGLVGLDFIIIDAEHGSYSYRDMEDMCRAANGVGMGAVIRVPNSSAEHILHAGDMGAQGIHLNGRRIISVAPMTTYSPIHTKAWRPISAPCRKTERSLNSRYMMPP